MISDNDKINMGKMKLQSSAVPPLKAGKYRLNTKIDVNNGAGGELETFENTSLSFYVSAPRFQLGSEIIHSKYPLNNATGAYHTSLPHIVLGKKTLPWERTIEGTEPYPWIALLLLTEIEVKEYTILIKKNSASQFIESSNTNVLIPNIQLENYEEEQEVSYIEIPLSLFKEISPSKEELSYLTHTRQVDTTLKESDTANSKGWFSTAIANRLPAKNQNNTVFMVSLEGHDKALSMQDNQGAKKVRLVVLTHWSFTAQGKTFAEQCEILTKSVTPFRIEKSLEKESKANKALEIGYMPINHEWRNGNKSVCWYRGPFVPVDIPTPENYIYKNADQALRFDKSTGMFDISYASAWQLGRMLALQNQSFFNALQNWEVSFKKSQPILIAKDILGLDKEDWNTLEKQIQEILPNEVLTDFLLKWANS